MGAPTGEPRLWAGRRCPGVHPLRPRCARHSALRRSHRVSLPVQGLWTAHYHDIDTREKLAKTAPNVVLVVNTAPRQCEARSGHYGPGVKVLVVDLEDDPDERKTFDCGLGLAVRDAPAALHGAERARRLFADDSRISVHKVLHECGRRDGGHHHGESPWIS
jgi:hypothetical protein